MYDFKDGRRDGIVVLATDGYGQVDYFSREFGISSFSVSDDVFRSFFEVGSFGPVDLLRRLTLDSDEIVSRKNSKSLWKWEIVHNADFSQAVCYNSKGRVIYRSLIDKGLPVCHPLWLLYLTNEMNRNKKVLFLLG